MTTPSPIRAFRPALPRLGSAHSPDTPRPARLWPVALAGAVMGTVVTLIWQFPASWAVGWISKGTDERVLLLDPRGTIWNGSAVLGVSGGPGSSDAKVLPGRLSWNLGFSRWPGRIMPAFELTLQQPLTLQQDARLRVLPTWSGAEFELQGLSMQMPANILQGLGTPWNTMGMDGTLLLTASRWSGTLAQGRLSQLGQGRLQLQSMTSPVTTIRPIGSYQIAFHAGDGGQPGPFRFTLQTLQGALQLSGEGELSGAGWRFRGEAGAEPEHRTALANVLNLIGNRNGPVAFIIRR